MQKLRLSSGDSREVNQGGESTVAVPALPLHDASLANNSKYQLTFLFEEHPKIASAKIPVL